MKKALVRIAPLRAGIVSACLYAAATLLFMPFIVIMVLAGSFAPKGGEGMAMGLGMGLLVGVFALVIYAIMGFIIGVIGAAIYNLIAGMTGGLVFETKEVPE